MIHHHNLIVLENGHLIPSNDYIYINTKSYNLDICTPVPNGRIYSWRTCRLRRLSSKEFNYVAINRHNFMECIRNIPLDTDQIQYALKYYFHTNPSESMVFGGVLFGRKLTTPYILNRLNTKEVNLYL